ncbi:LpxI family protein [Henriciella barbarensis]|uniref:LpxI family protein n=1 Tax=Henriciella barbarensis TaxID=86342 RepID=A0A399R9P6_9PROT|nr:UDP-2,3-diacylglucosamine diphosphatase LpxI [Henriciella barbarensis]RIJ26229.1 LpxI family protein [Henriciella barbarensis]
MKKLAIIAGLGDLPVSIALAARERGQDLHVFRLSGFEEKRLEAFDHETLGIGQIGHLIKRLKKVGCEQVVLAGIVKRPNFSDIKLDIRGAKLLPRVLKAARSGDDALLRVIVAELEAEGFDVIAAESAAQELTVGEGLIFGQDPSEAELADLRKAARIASELGRLDIGQGCVVCDGLVLAVEAQEGTDRMLGRINELEDEIRGASTAPRGVLVKRPKPIQERRIDLPTIGPMTIQKAAEAGLAGIGVEAKGALLLNRDEIGRRCADTGVFLFAFPKNWS